MPWYTTIYMLVMAWHVWMLLHWSTQRDYTWPMTLVTALSGVVLVVVLAADHTWWSLIPGIPATILALGGLLISEVWRQDTNRIRRNIRAARKAAGQ